MSGGEKQRVVLALALACRPALILFDEPTSALDATTAATLLDLIRRLRDEAGLSALFISHDLGTVADIADRVAVIYGGQIVEEAEAGVLFATPVHPYTRALVASLPRPSDGRTGRGLDAGAGETAPAPRTGPLPACIYSHLCPFHRPEVCDASPVRPRPLGLRRIACARAEALPADADAATALAPTAPGDTTILAARDMNVRFADGSLLARLMGRAARSGAGAQRRDGRDRARRDVGAGGRVGLR